MSNPTSPETPQRSWKPMMGEKKRKYLKDCLEQRCHFTPFEVSTDGLIDREVKTLMKKLSAILAEKWEKQAENGDRWATVDHGICNRMFSYREVKSSHLVKHYQLSTFGNGLASSELQPWRNGPAATRHFIVKRIHENVDEFGCNTSVTEAL
jgi:hypothetical protein